MLAARRLCALTIIHGLTRVLFMVRCQPPNCLRSGKSAGTLGQNGERDLCGFVGFHNISRARCFVSNERWSVRLDYIRIGLLVFVGTGWQTCLRTLRSETFDLYVLSFLIRLYLSLS